MAVVARLWVAGELVNAAKMNTISTDLTELSGRVGTEIAAVSQTVTNAIAALGSASTHDVGTGDGNVPELDSSGHLENARLSEIPRTALSTASGTATVTASGNTSRRSTFFLAPAYAFTPTAYWERDSDDSSGNSAGIYHGVQRTGRNPSLSDDRMQRWELRTDGEQSSRSGDGTAHWLYLSTSHRPSVWVRQTRVLADDGTETDDLIPDVWSLWIAEDPIVDGDTRSPLESGAVNIGLPSDAILSALMATRPAAQTTWIAHLTSRGWVTTSPATYSDTIDLVSDRYKPAARLWAMRAIAEADGIGEAAAYLTLLQVGSGNTWELP